MISTAKRIWQHRNDSYLGFLLTTKFAKLAAPDYRFKWPSLDWWNNGAFTRYLKQFELLDGYNTDRYWMLSQLLRLIGRIPGDTAECGVYQGASSYLISLANSQSEHNRTHFMFDSFEGLSKPDVEDGNHWSPGDLACGEDVVRKNLREFNKISLHKGWIPDRFQDVKNRKFAFVHVDVDLYQPTKDSIGFFYERLSPGGILVCDDYGSTACPGATQAIDEFLEDKQEKMIMLPDCGGFLIKDYYTLKPVI